MNIAKSIVNREKGLEHIEGYDTALFHLKCYKEDLYAGVSPNEYALDYNPKPPILACQFSTAPGYEQIIALANEDGKIAFQDTTIRNGSEKPLEGTQARLNAIFDIAWMPQELKLVTVSGDRAACLWDASSDLKLLQEFQGHTHSIKSVVFRHQDKAVFATGARDGAIMIWDIRANHSGQPKPDNSIFNAHEIRVPKQRRTPSSTPKLSKPPSVTALAFQDDYTLISCSVGDGLIKVWDLRKNYTGHKKEPIAKHIMNYGGKSNIYNGFSSLMICPAGITLYASCVDKKIYAYNISSYSPNPIAEYYGHVSDDKCLTFFVKACLSPDGKYLAWGSNDESAYIWRTRSPGTPIIKLTGHRDEVTSIAWCNVGETKLVTCSDDANHRIWRIRPEPVGEEDKMNIFGCAERYEISNNLESSSPPPSGTPNSVSSVDGEADSSSKPRSSCASARARLDSSPRRPSQDTRAARKLLFSPGERAEQCPTFSPTSGLPNFVVDGTAPHLLENSPRKSKENVDWLTMMRKRKGVADESPSPKARKTPARRLSRLRSAELRKTPKSRFVPAITNFYSNLEGAKLPSPCSS